MEILRSKEIYVVPGGEDGNYVVKAFHEADGRVYQMVRVLGTRRNAELVARKFELSRFYSAEDGYKIALGRGVDKWVSKREEKVAFISRKPLAVYISYPTEGGNHV